MARLVLLSPLPPAPSEAAMEGRALGRLLRTRHHDVVSLWPIPESIEALLGVSDLAVYQVANQLEEREIYTLAIERPGLVILHDLALDRLVRGLMAVHEPVGIESGRHALAAFERFAGQDPGEVLRIPWAAHLMRRSRGVVVHSVFAARYLEAIGARTPTFVAPPPSVADRRPLRRARSKGRRLRAVLRTDRVIGVVGDVGPEMGLEIVLGAAATLGARAVVVSQQPVGDAADAYRRSFDGEPLTWAVSLPEDEMAAWLAACDAVVDIRHPPRGTIPTSTVRALQLGIPVVASSPHSVPDGVEVTILSTSPPEAEEVTEALGRLLAQRATASRRDGATLERLAATARGAYLQAVDRTLELVHDPVRWTLGRWGAALADSGVPEGWVRRGYGTRYTDALEELRPR